MTPEYVASQFRKATTGIHGIKWFVSQIDKTEFLVSMTASIGVKPCVHAYLYEFFDAQQVRNMAKAHADHLADCIPTFH